MLHKAWNSKGEMPYCFPMSSIKFQGHTGQNITDFDPNWAFPDYRLVVAFKSLRFALITLYQNSAGYTMFKVHIFALVTYVQPLLSGPSEFSTNPWGFYLVRLLFKGCVWESPCVCRCMRGVWFMYVAQLKINHWYPVYLFKGLHCLIVEHIS